MARRPTIEDVLERARSRKTATGSRLSKTRIIVHRDADRR
jgi:hypothetical protein